MINGSLFDTYKTYLEVLKDVKERRLRKDLPNMIKEMESVYFALPKEDVKIYKSVAAAATLLNEGLSPIPISKTADMSTFRMNFIEEAFWKTDASLMVRKGINLLEQRIEAYTNPLAGSH